MTPLDQGPIYKETVLGRFPVEPWNTYSNGIFLMIIAFFAYRICTQRVRAPIFLVALPILGVGFLGGTLFHATRSYRVWLYMDFIPIFVLAMLATYYFWGRLTGNRMFAFALCLLPFLIMRVLVAQLPLPRHLTISLGYSTLALTIILPALLFSRHQRWKGARSLAGAVLAFAVAVICRSLDRESMLPMGTHFLWHLFGGVSTFLMLHFLFLAEYSAEHKERNPSTT